MPATFADLHLATRAHENFARFYPGHAKAPSSSSSPPSKRGRAEHKKNSSAPRIFALDCEMVMTVPKTDDGLQANVDGVAADYTLARASLVELVGFSENEQGELREVLDVYVKTPVDRLVTDRLEHVSGITQHHLDTATVTLDNLVSRLEQIVDSHSDYLVGHSLYNDLSVLPGWLPVPQRVIETSFLFKVKSHPRITLSLKDALMETAKEDIHVDRSASHDSVQDAMACLKICRAMLTTGRGATCELEEVPARFCRQVVLHKLTQSMEPGVERMLAGFKPDEYFAKPIKWTTADKSQGSLCIEFTSPERAEDFFLNSLVSVEGRCHFDGFPYNKAGHLRKFAQLKGDEEKDRVTCEATSHIKTALTHRLEFTCKQSEMGKLLGSKGKQILHIQHTSGVIISNQQNPANKTVVFEILADKLSKCEQAVIKMALAQQGKYDAEF